MAQARVSMKGHEMVPADFQSELCALINKHSVEQCGDVPDYILARYLCDCIEAFHVAAKSRDKWFGQDLRIPDRTNSNT